MRCVAFHDAPGHDWVHDIPAFKNIRWFGYYIAATIGLCAAGWMHGRRLHFAVAVAALAIALWTGSRGTLAAICGGYALTAALFPLMRQGSRRFLSLILLGMVLALIFDACWPLEGQGLGRLTGDGGCSGRLEIWARTLAAIGAHPWMGHGEAQFRDLLHIGTLTHPHNIVLQLLLAWGIVGAALIAVPAVWLARHIRTGLSRSEAPFLFAAANLIVFSLIDGSLFHVLSTALFALWLGVLGAARREAANPS